MCTCNSVVSRCFICSRNSIPILTNLMYCTVYKAGDLTYSYLVRFLHKVILNSFTVEALGFCIVLSEDLL